MAVVGFRADAEFLRDLDAYVSRLQSELGPMVTVTRSSVIKTIVRERLDRERRKTTKRGRKK